MIGDDSPYVDSSRYRLAYLYASPLIEPRTGSEIEILDTQKEIEILRQCLRESGRRIHFKVDVATPQNLRAIATIGAVMIHYSGHGIPGELVFEDGRGGIHHVDVDLLKPFFSAGGVQTKLVFVGTCHSEAAGRKFVEAGVPHVIAVNNRVADISSRIFAQHLYFALFSGKKTVREAFDIASNMIMVLEGSKPTDNKKFILLPEDGDHDVIIFQNAPKGRYIDETDPLAPNGCDRPPKYFVGRKHAIYEIYFRLGANNNRWVTIRGERGIGKTALAFKACQYMNERKLFDVIYFVPLRRIGASPHDDHNTLAHLVASCMYRAGDGIFGTEDLINELTGARDEGNSENHDEHDDGRNTLGPSAVRSPAADIGSKFPSHIASWMRVLLVFDAADDFVSESECEIDCEPDVAAVSGSFDANSDKKGSVCPVDSLPEAGVVSYGAVDESRGQSGLGLITLVGEILRRTENVKLLFTSRQRLVGGHMVWQVNEPEKVVSVERLSKRLSADLLVRLAPRGLKPSEVMSDNALTALDTLAARPVVKDLSGHPRAIARFALLLADRMLDDSEELRSIARGMLKKAQEWRDSDTVTHPPSPAGGATPNTPHGAKESGNGTSGRSTSSSGNIALPVAVAIAAPLTPGRRDPSAVTVPNAAVFMNPGRVQRSATEGTLRNKDSAVPATAVHRQARSTSTVNQSNGVSQLGPPVVQPHMRLSASAGILPQDRSGANSSSNSLNSRGSRGIAHSHSQPFLRGGFPRSISATGRVCSDVNLEEARRAATAVIPDQACAEVWARVSASNTAGGNMYAPPLSSVRWSVLIAALSESLKQETKVMLNRQDMVGSLDPEDDNLVSISMNRKLTKEDARFLEGRIKLDEAMVVSGRGRTDGAPTVDYMITRSRFIVFSEEWWAPLLATLRLIDAEFACSEPIIIHGFLSRQAAVKKLLATNEVGVFLLRFSESQKGLLVVSFTDLVPVADNSGGDKTMLVVHNCLVNVEANGLSIYFDSGQSTYNTLEDLIMSCPGLRILYPNIPKEMAFDRVRLFRS